MEKLKINLKNCYGIKSLEKEFDFETNANGKARAYAIYAPNGTMKTSFSKTFENLSKGSQPREERYKNVTTCEVVADGDSIAHEMIYVLKAELDICKGLKILDTQLGCF